MSNQSFNQINRRSAANLLNANSTNFELLQTKQREFIDTFGKRISTVSTQSVDAYTLLYDESMIVTIQCRSVPKDYKFVSLNNYADGSRQNYDQKFKDNLKETQGFFFHTLKRSDSESEENCSLAGYQSISKRFWQDDYKRCIFSNDQKRLIMVHFQKSIKDFINKQTKVCFDVFDCSDPEFFTSGETISNQDSSFLFSDSYQTNINIDQQLRIEFSKDDRYLYVATDNILKIFRMPGENEEQKLIQTNELPELNIQMNKTYDKIDTVHLNSDDIQKSLILLRSTAFSLVHIVTFASCKETLTAVKVLSSISNNKTKHQFALGGDFVIDDDSHNIKHKVHFFDIDGETIEPQFKFSKDGKKLLIQSKQEAKSIITCREDMAKFGKVKELPHLIGNYKIFKREDNDFLFLEHCEESGKLELNFMQPTGNESIGNIQLSLNAYKESLDLLECQELQNGSLRIISIEDGQCMTVYEQKKNEQAVIEYQLYDHPYRSFSWPYFAYCVDDMILLNQLSDSQTIVYKKTGFRDLQKDIVGLASSSKQNLFVIVEAEEAIEFYKIDLNLALGPIKQSHNALLSNSQVTNTSKLFIKLGECQKQNIKAKLVDQFRVYEQNYGRVSKYSFLFVANNSLRMVSIIKDNVSQEILAKKISDLQAFSPSKLIYRKQGSNEVTLVDLCDSENSHKSIHKQVTRQLIKYIAGARKLQVLSQDSEQKYYLETLDWDGHALTDRSIIKIDESNHKIIRFIKNSQSLVDRVLLMQNGCVRIYDNKQNSRIENFDNFLPDINDTSPLRIILKSTLKCSEERRFCVFLKNIEEQQPTQVIFMPYLQDNSLKFRGQENSLTWFHTVTFQNQPATHLAIQEHESEMEHGGKQTTMMQFCLEKFSLSHYNMNGLLINSKSFANEEDSICFLAIMPQKPIILVTHRDRSYLRNLTLKQIEVTQENGSYKYEIIESHLNTQEILLQNDKQTSVYQFLSNIKNKFSSCHFDFQLNNKGDILIAVLVDDVILEILVIENSQKKASRYYIVKEDQGGVFSSKRKATVYSADQAEKHNQLTAAIISNDKEFQSPKLQRFLDCNRYLLADDKVIAFNNKKMFFAKLQEHKFELQKSKFELPEADENTYLDRIFQTNNRDVEGKKGWFSNAENPYSIVLRIISCAGSINEKVTYTNYSFEVEKEQQQYESSMNSQLFFDQQKTPFILDDNGIINLETKEILLQYHMNDQKLSLKLLQAGIQWSSRFSDIEEHSQPGLAGKFLLFAKTLVFPYNYLSLIQHHAAKDYERFDPNDFYKFDGKTIFHKYKQRPQIQEKILDSFYQQDKIYCLTILQNSGYEYGIDLIERAIELSIDRFINKILAYLSEQPSKFSFFQLIPVYHKLFDYKNFELLLDQWFAKTAEMQEMTVCFTGLKQGLHLKNHNSTWLDQEFQKTFKAQQQDEVNDNGMDQSILIKGKLFSRKPVDCKYFHAKWLYAERKEDEDESPGKLFLKSLAENENLDYFRNKTIQNIVHYQWSIMRGPIIRRFFLPFLILGYIPYMTFAIYSCSYSTEKFWNSEPDQIDYLVVFYDTLLAMMFLYSGIKLYGECYEIKSKCCSYFIQIGNLLDLTLILILLFTVMVSLQLTYGIETVTLASNAQLLTQLRGTQVVGVILFNLQLFDRLRSFSFFATFVRSMIEIMKVTLPLLTVLFMAIIAQTVCYILLEMNATEQFQKFFNSLMAVYYLALGDFENTLNYNAKEKSYLFWFLFLFGTIFMMIILLNMIIAVMSISYEGIIEESEAVQVREKLNLMLESEFFIKGAVEDLRQTTNLVSFEVDPEVSEQQEQTNKMQEHFAKIQAEVDNLKNTMEMMTSRHTAANQISYSGFEKITQMIEQNEKRIEKNEQESAVRFEKLKKLLEERS